MSLTIRRNHPVVQIAFLFNGMEPPEYGRGYRPYQTSLCVLFWRCVLTVVGVLGFTTLAGGLVGFVGWKLYHVPWDVWKFVLEIIGFSLLTSLAVYGLITLGLRHKWGQKLDVSLCVAADKIEKSVAIQTVKSVKSRVCPIINFGEPQKS